MTRYAYLSIISGNPWVNGSVAKIWFAASVGWNPSQNMYCGAFAHVPTDISLQRRDVSIPVPQQAFLDSKNPLSNGLVTMSRRGWCKDFYDISFFQGYNLPATIGPRIGSYPRDAVCGSELSIRASNGGVIGCKSACLAFNTDTYCCRGSNNTP